MTFLSLRRFERLGKALTMIRKFDLRRWLASGPLSGRKAVVVGLLAVLIPTGFLAAFDGAAGEVAVAPYVPFILLSAIMLTWLNASLVALASMIIDDAFFVGTPPHLLEGPQDMLAIGVFLIVAGVIIGFVELVKSIISDKPTPSDEVHSGIIFSLEGGQAWASRPGLGGAVRLGPETEVAEMMEDFLAQRELARRLSKSAAE